RQELTEKVELNKQQKKWLKDAQESGGNS
ncbi:MAG: tRNA (guanosine(37)-N1)-methyltransferase TrmD, partial [Acinetobacter oleivorans]|nr:tRNA (guanosine(37)-N1)-methyltransferase TrmD [Acinetobacter oleivorans]